MKEITSLFALKAIAAFLVVMCHIPMFTKGVWEPIMTMAVPCFFMITGYFLYDRDEGKSYARAIKSIKRTLPIVLVVNLFYYLWIFPNHGNTIHSLSQIVDWVLFGGQVSGHLWYLTAMVEALAILALILHFRKGAWITLLPLLALANILLGKYYFLTDGLLPKQNIYTVFYSALPFISMGYLIHKWEERLLTFRHWGLVFVFSLAISWIEYISLNKLLISLPNSLISAGNLFVFTLLAAVALMALALKYPSEWQNGRTYNDTLCTIGKYYSGSVYYFHVAMGSLLAKILFKLGVPVVYEMAGALLVFLLCIPLAWGIQKVQDRIGVHILR